MWKIQRFELPSAERWAKQFCKICGSGLPYISRAGTHLVIPAGSLDGEIGVQPDDSIFWNSRAEWVETKSDKPKFPEYPDKF
ncbi:MAG: GFA family protein [SAR324 cluster bacterium]|nr:GFA family protein [SAR324 cluster bacterium]